MNSQRTYFWPVVVIGFAAFVLGAFAFTWRISRVNFPPVDASRWQAVFLTNNQVYFGHLENFSRVYVRLSRVYYLRAQENLQQGSSGASQNLNLVKLGGELHGPEDEMYIPKDKIQFWENLKASSNVVRAIEASR